MTSFIRWVFAFCLLLFVAGPAFSQSRNTGEIRGTVSAAAAVVPGATVTLTNIDTGETKTFLTNQDGIYDTVSTPAGNYTISFSAKGFKKLVKGPIPVQVDVITENASLEVGAVTETITVEAGGAPLVETETGQQGHIMDSKTMTELPQSGGGITGADWASFNIYLPGAGGTTNGRVSQAGGAWNAGDAVSINGNLPNFGNFLQDGASTLLPASYNNDDEIFETVQEVQVNTSSFSAQYGMGGVMFNQISKGGTNSWHGSGYEFFSQNFLNANNYFSSAAPKTITTPTGSQIPNPAAQVPYLRYDQFGASVGGPIIKNKFFFFFDIDRIVNNSASNGFVSVPTAAMLQGDFTGMQPIYDPLTTTGSGPTLARASFASECGGLNMIPDGTNCGGAPSRMDPVAAAIIASKYGWPTAPQGVGTCTNPLYPNECTNNLYLAHINPAPVHRYFGRLDYNLSQNNRINFSISQKDNPGVDNGLFACPLNCGAGDVDGYNTQVSDVWTITPTLVNEIRMGYTKQGNWFLSQSVGLNPATAFGLQGTHFNQFPFIGNSSIYGGFGGPSPVTALSPATDAIYIENSFDPSDMLTLVKGRHVLHFGIEVLMAEGNTTAWGSNSAGNYGFTGQYTQGVTAAGALDGTTGSGFADFLLGNVQGWAANNQGLTGMRLKSPQAFVQDDWKIKPNLTINLGLRWTGNTGMTEVQNKLGDFDPNLVNTTGPFAGTLGSIWIAPQDNRTSLQKPVWNIFLPRAGFAWSVKDNTVFRGGIGFFAYNYSMDLYGGEGGAQMGFGATFQGGNSDPNSGAGDTGWIAGTTNTTPLYLSSSAAMMANAMPYIQGSKDPASYTINPVFNLPYEPYDIKPGEIWEWNFSVEHQFARDFAVSATYVGSHGANLQFVTDANQITNPALLAPNDISGCNGATPATPKSSTTVNPCARPYPAFGTLTGSNFDGISNYNSLQLDLRKRSSYGLTFDVNYAWSHMLDDQDSAGWGSTAGQQAWQIGNNPSANYGNSNFDIPQALKGTAVYELPFGMGKPFMNQNAILDAALGGWRISGTFIYQDGTPFTVLDSGVFDYSQAGNVFANPIAGMSPTSGSCPATSTTPAVPVHTLGCWFNTAAFQTAAEQPVAAFGYGRRNTLFGPKLSDVNLSLAKTWHYKERAGLTLRADFVNAFNHPSFGLPNNDLNSGISKITTLSNGPRTIQLGARISF